MTGDRQANLASSMHRLSAVVLRPALSSVRVGTPTDHSWDKRLAELSRPAVLILDDFGMREYSATQADDLYELVSARAACGHSLVLTSNRSPSTGIRCSPTRRGRCSNA